MRTYFLLLGRSMSSAQEGCQPIGMRDRMIVSIGRHDHKVAGDEVLMSPLIGHLWNLLAVISVLTGPYVPTSCL